MRMKRMYRRLCWLLMLALMIGTLLCGCEKGLPRGVEADSIRYTPGTVNYQVSVIERDGKFGLIDFKGNIVLPIEYNSIELGETEPNSGATMLCASGSSNVSPVLLEADGTISDIEASAWGYDWGGGVYWSNGVPMVWMRQDGVVGSTFEAYKRIWHPEYNLLGTIALTPSTVVPVQEMKGYTKNEYDETVVDVVSEKYALLDFTTGKLITDFVYEDYSNVGFVEGVLAVKKDGKWGYINEQGTALTAFEYDTCVISDDNRWSSIRMYASTNGYIVVRQGDKWGLIDNKGNTVVEPIYDDISQVNDKGQFWAKSGGKWSVEQLPK